MERNRENGCFLFLFCFPFLFYSCSFPTLLLFPSIYTQYHRFCSVVSMCGCTCALVIIFNYFNTIQGINSRSAAYKWKLYKNNLSAHTCKRTNYHTFEWTQCLTVMCRWRDSIPPCNMVEKNGNWTGFWSAREIYNWWPSRIPYPSMLLW